MRRTLLMFLLAGTLLGGCYPYLDQSVEDYDSVFTFYAQEGVDYDSYGTFALLDTVLTWDKDGKLVANEGTTDRVILDRFRENLLDAGYTEVSDPFNDDPDLVAVVRVSSTTVVNINYWYPWYGGWGGWYYPWYPVTSVSSYSTGSIFLDLIDPDMYDPATDRREGVWTAYCSGLLTGSTANREARVRNAVDQAFRQSPYLQPQ